MAIDDLGDHVGEVDVRIDASEFTGFDQRGDDRPTLTATSLARRDWAIVGQALWGWV
jgi:hypothetical protein